MEVAIWLLWHFSGRLPPMCSVKWAENRFLLPHSFPGPHKDIIIVWAKFMKKCLESDNLPTMSECASSINCGLNFYNKKTFLWYFFKHCAQAKIILSFYCCYAMLCYVDRIKFLMLGITTSSFWVRFFLLNFVKKRQAGIIIYSTNTSLCRSKK